MRKPVIILAGLALAGLAAGGGVAFADQNEADPVSPTATATPGTGDGTSTARKPAVLAEQAQQTALSRVSGGWIVSSDLETEGGTASWEVEVADGKGAEREIVIDATTGKITSEAADTDADDAQEKDGQDDD
ncbi:PepSY domain-containing protein [Streptosporangium sp. NBC_01639]|uniref:PepSY domain-containing protein n=1 Tax=Streptosporangium sp. NBC_01639 TaxID=2975948 RepID=UPI003870BC49|nr:PepSY domain-containing protein [Streptosporangium sp. NBC_01639]